MDDNNGKTDLSKLLSMAEKTTLIMTETQKFAFQVATFYKALIREKLSDQQAFMLTNNFMILLVESRLKKN